MQTEKQKNGPQFLNLRQNDQKNSIIKTDPKHSTLINLNDLDLKLISILQDDCRKSCRKIGKMIGLSGTLVAKRIQNLEKKGFLKGYSVITNPIELGYDLTGIIYIQAEAGYLDTVELELAKLSNIIIVYEVTGDFDLIAIAKLKDRESLNILIKDLLITPHVKRTLTNISLKVVKEDFKIPI